MASASVARIPSRTAEGKHTKRFIVLFKDNNFGDSNTWNRSLSLPGFYVTREEAQAAINDLFPVDGLVHKVRQK